MATFISLAGGQDPFVVVDEEPAAVEAAIAAAAPGTLVRLSGSETRMALATTVWINPANVVLIREQQLG